MRIRLWFVGETEEARRYCKVPKSRHPASDDFVWIPRSVVSHTQKRPSVDGIEWAEHELQVEDWFSDKVNL